MYGGLLSINLNFHEHEIKCCAGLYGSFFVCNLVVLQLFLI